ncbi:MAG: hypothetical protein VKO64_07620 [Candidatus Sericytochromatia bacterium]|nr:hypothetical protein [Candidatus Sericytochromatia bacterium]
MPSRLLRLLSCAVLALAGCGWAPPQRPGLAATGDAGMLARSAGVLTALSGLAAAERAALAWDDRARLARIVGGPMMSGYMVHDWTYAFVSGKRPREMVVLQYGEQGMSTRVALRDPELEALADRPRIDSDQAAAVAVRQGMTPGRFDVIRLDQVNPQRRATWTLDAPEGTFRLDARTGLFLP